MAMNVQYECIIEFDYNELKSHYCKYYDTVTFEHWYNYISSSPERLKRALDHYNCLHYVAWRLKQ